MNKSPRSIHELIKLVKKRWVSRILQKGIGILILTFLFFAISYLLLTYLLGPSSLIQSVLITLAVLTLLTQVGLMIVRPLLRGLDDQKFALFIEEKMPQLEDRINSAVEIGESEWPEKTEIIDKLIDDATKEISTIQLSEVIERKKERILSGSAFALLFMFVAFILIFSEDVKNLTANMEFSLNPKTHFQQEIMKIAPGDVQIEKGESVDIVAELKNETDREFNLHYRMNDSWFKEALESALDKRSFMYRFVNIQSPIQYYVTYDDIRSSDFQISIYEFPRVTQIDLNFDYPAYTGIPDRIEEKTGNIRGLKGAEVTLTIHTSGATRSGEMIINDSESVPLSPAGNGTFRGKLTLGEPSVYHVKLTDDNDKNNKFPEEYQITPVEDLQPIISVTDPQRDVRVNAVEEVLVSTSVSDDFGVKSARLKFSVNGAEEQSIDLVPDSGKRPGQKDVTGSHVFYLEDYGLEPGDVISYYVEAEDYFHTKEPGLTDMYFIEVTPFDANYTQLNNQGGGSGGGGGGSQTVINQQTIINATWNLLRKKDEMSKKEFEETANSLKQAQENLKDNIDQRINSTAFSLEMAVDEQNKEIADLLRDAVEQMSFAVDELDKRALKQALTPERKALNYLLKADAKNKDRMVQRGQMAGGGGGGGQSEERMTELMDLELDISKDKYEMKQQNSQQQNQEMDDALQKIRDLAKKQQLLSQQSRDNLQQEQDRRQLDRLQRDQEDVRQQSEELARQMREMGRENGKMTDQMQARMDQISRTLKQAEQAMKDGRMQQSMAKQNQAIDELDRLQQDMRSRMTEDVRDMLDSFTKNFQTLKQREQQLSQDIQKEYQEIMDDGGRVTDTQGLKQLAEKRENVIKGLKSIENEAKAVEEQAQSEAPDVATDLRNVRNAIKRENIEENMARSGELLKDGWLTYANMLEDEIQQGLEAVEEQVGKLENEMTVTEEERLSRSLQDTRNMLNRLEDAMAQADREGQQADRSQQAGQGQQQQESDQEQRDQESDQNGNQGSNPNSAARMSRLLEQSRQMLDRMAQEFRENGGIQQTLRNTMHSFSPRTSGTLIEDEEFFKNNVYSPLSQLEKALLERLDEIELEKKLYSARKEEVPSEYRKLVDKYFESIAK